MLRSAIKTTLLLGALTGLLVLVGGIFGGERGAIFAFFIALAMNFFSYWFSDKMVLRAYNAQELDPSAAPELYSIVQELAQEAHIPVPRMYLIDTDTPNAFATGRSPHHAAVAVTRGILRILQPRRAQGCARPRAFPRYQSRHLDQLDRCNPRRRDHDSGFDGAMGRIFRRLRRRWRR